MRCSSVYRRVRDKDLHIALGEVFITRNGGDADLGEEKDAVGGRECNYSPFVVEDLSRLTPGG